MAKLSQEIVIAIQEVIQEKKEQKAFHDNLVIKDGIFDILEKHCKVLYYPVKNTNNCGFHTKRFVKNELVHFAYINTAKPLAEQVFAAAHELGHALDIAQNVMAKLGRLDELSSKLEEDIVNRFAAELLMPEELFLTNLNFYKEKFVDNAGSPSFIDMCHIILMQMHFFMTSYGSVRKRLVETSVIGEEQEKVLIKHDEFVLKYLKTFSRELNTMLDTSTNKIAIPELRELIEKVEEKGLLDKNFVCKVKHDFGIDDLDDAFATINILPEDKTNGED